MSDDRRLLTVRCGLHDDGRPTLGYVVMRSARLIYVPKLDRSRVRDIHERWTDPGVADWTIDDLASEADLSAGIWPLVYCHNHGVLTAPETGADVDLLTTAIEVAQASYSGGPTTADVVIHDDV